MPRRAAPGNRERIEAELGPHRAALISMCEALDLPPARWQRVAPLEAAFSTLAVVRLAERLQVETGACWEAAVGTAAARLDVSEKTAQSRLARWLADAYRPAT